MLEIIGTIFIIVFGTLSHFFYDWSHHNKIVGYLAAVNESVWEHLKLVVVPSFIWLAVEIHFYPGNANLFFARLAALFTTLLTIPLIFYSYTRFTKRPILAVDISSFIIAIILGQLAFVGLINFPFPAPLTGFLNHVGIIGLIILFFIFMINTYAPQKNFLLKDPITHKYGIHAHVDHTHKKPKTPIKS